MISETKTVRVNKMSLLEIEVERLPNSDKLSIFVKSEKLGEFMRNSAGAGGEEPGTSIVKDANGGSIELYEVSKVNLEVYRAFPPRIPYAYGGVDLDFLRIKDLDKGVRFVVRSQAKKEQVKDWILSVKDAVEEFYKENMKPLKYRMNLSIEEII